MQEDTDPATRFDERPLLVLALGGNALSPPAAGGDDYRVEREIIQRSAKWLNRLAADDYRLLIVHGNGPQVGRLLRQDPSHGNLDIHVAQTQGELGYLLAAAMNEPTVCLLTRVIVAEDPGRPVKPVGPVLAERPSGPSTKVGDGWRATVSSPRPLKVVEASAIATLLTTQHVIAGGGGGIPRSSANRIVDGVVDKDWVAALLAIRLSAEHLVFATDVDGVYQQPDEHSGDPLRQLDLPTARSYIETGKASVGSMAPKLESACDFAAATGRAARICALDQIEAALSGKAGTRIG